MRTESSSMKEKKFLSIDFLKLKKVMNLARPHQWLMDIHSVFVNFVVFFDSTQFDDLKAIIVLSTIKCTQIVKEKCLKNIFELANWMKRDKFPKRAEETN